MPALSADESAVLEANAAFYEAFAKGDSAAMDALWAERAPIACIHPGWDVLRGRTKVMASWRAILSGRAGPPIQYSGPTAHVLGDTAFVVCHEVIEGTRLVATNTFVREGQAWKMVHHQAAPIAQGAEDDDDDDEMPPPPSGVLN
jgi:ketosteroid isomerase-like protein